MNEGSRQVGPEGVHWLMIPEDDAGLRTSSKKFEKAFTSY